MRLDETPNLLRRGPGLKLWQAIRDEEPGEL